MVESVPCSFPEIPGMRRGRALVLASAQGKMLSFPNDLPCGQLATARKSYMSRRKIKEKEGKED